MAQHHQSEYPFAGTPYAQSSNEAHHSSQYSAYPQFDSPQGAPHNAPYPTSPDYAGGYEDPNGEQSYNQDTDRTLRDATYSSEKAYPATSPYSPYGGATPYSSGHIREKGAWSRRSVPVKILRTLVCVIVLAIIFIVSIVSLIVIFVRPPNVAFTGIKVPNANSVGIDNGAFTFNITVQIAVSNPNSISATLSHITATAYDSVAPSTTVGSGNLNDVKIETHQNTTINFPFQIQYNQNKDPSRVIIKDIATKCGWIGNSQSDLQFTLDLDLKLSVLSVGIPIKVNRDISFECPISASQVQDTFGDILSGLGVSRRELAPQTLLRSLWARGDELTSLLDGLVARRTAKRSAGLLHDAL